MWKEKYLENLRSMLAFSKSLISGMKGWKSGSLISPTHPLDTCAEASKERLKRLYHQFR